jgi:cobalt-zinc-cadmium efflux system outer membrane protein
MGNSATPQTDAGESVLPSELEFSDGVTEDEAIVAALSTNAAFRQLLADLDISNAQLFNAGLLPDPQFVLFFPVGPKQLELTAYQAIDALWLRRVHVRAAELEYDRVAEQLVQNGLDLIRDVRLAHAELVLAQDQADLAVEAERLRNEIADLAQRRLEAGDVSELEVISTEVEAARARAEAQRRARDVAIARDRLKVLTGLAQDERDVMAIPPELPDKVDLAVEGLLAEALATRPDARAAEVAAEAACEQLELARRQFLTLDAVFDANEKGASGFEAGPGLRFTIPLFNGNRGGIAIAEANLEKAERQYASIQDRIALEVRTAATQLRQAQENLAAVRTDILPTLEEAEGLVRRNYQEGGTSYFLVLQTTGQFLDARVSELLLEADVRRAVAELERSVGRRLITSPAPFLPIHSSAGEIAQK